MSRLHVFASTTAVAIGAAACADLATAGPDASPADAPPALTAAPSSGLPTAPPAAARTWDVAVEELARTRGVGPLVPATARMTCSGSRVFWQDEAGRVASWSVRTRTLVRYATSMSTDDYARPSDAFVPLRPRPFGMAPGAAYAYRADAEDVRVAEVPWGDEVVATDDGVLFVGETRNAWSGAPTSTWVRLWRPGHAPVQVGDDLPAQSGRFLGFGAGKLVVASTDTAYVRGLDGKTSRFPLEASSSPRHAVPTAEGLFVMSARKDAAPDLRLYREYEAARGEDIGDILRKMPALVDDAPAGEHDPDDGPIAAHAGHVLFTSSFGIFAYAAATGSLKALVLHPRGAAGPSELCVMPGAATLAYRRLSDATGQIWTVPLDTLFP